MEVTEGVGWVLGGGMWRCDRGVSGPQRLRGSQGSGRRDGLGGPRRREEARSLSSLGCELGGDTVTTTASQHSVRAGR